MRRTIFAAYFFTIASLLVLAGFSQNKAFQGQVLFEDGSHVPFAEVKIYEDGTENLISAQVADLYGHFELQPLAPGNYILEFSYVGHEDVVKKVKVTEVRSPQLGAIKLVPSAGLEHLVVTPKGDQHLSS